MESELENLKSKITENIRKWSCATGSAAAVFLGNSWFQKFLVNQQNMHKIKIMCRQNYVGQRSLIIAYEHLKRPLWEDFCWGLKNLL